MTCWGGAATGVDEPGVLDPNEALEGFAAELCGDGVPLECPLLIAREDDEGIPDPDSIVDPPLIVDRRFD